MWLHVTPHECLPVRARFRYDRAQPFEVRAEFTNAGGGAATWVLARELLKEGFERTSGEGEIRILPPCPCSYESSMHILLLRPTGVALLDIPSVALRTWLASTFAVVPAGTAGQLIDWDASFLRLLSRRNR
ncbi:SsgA family sporulation/cell division regulator [Streptomyces gilvus]|uniref:SsgA family sporulation/cell division regulator n=1 Tax=Streptomyces gilvus TaxID=2920937 RepID=UPI001F0D1B64|nr:SsgA family sporulation/cell division regulator [Streptomyces sp. CME 23]MCH5676888.1 SsgA family sporulation/cell division regulator [Streptomyces sp. CME 23]